MTASGSEQWKEVGVDQAALVKKILSDYSGPFDVFRELIQNADDANAKNIEIYFETDENEDVSKWVIRDDGKGLEGDQWQRLCVIASGNDASGKVGTFGVGFYTVLGVCDCPMMKSNGECQEMYLRDQLYVKPERDPCETGGWTSVELILKDSLKERLPCLPDLARFLISSITFLENVNTITVFLADQKVLCIGKKLGDSSLIDIHAVASSPDIMTIKSIRSARQRVSVHAIGEGFLPDSKTRPSEETARGKGFVLSQALDQSTTSQPSEASETQMEWMFEAAYCLYTAQIDPPPEMKEGVKMIVKDLPRNDFSCKAVYFQTEQRKVVEESPLRHLFDGLDGILPRNNSGRVFIGQSTKELTGVGLHIESKHIVPDVVRSSVRLGNGQVDEWNKSLLNTAGYLARAIYEREMMIASKSEEPSKLTELGLYTMHHFAFERRPASRTSHHLKYGFFSPPNLNVLSNSGIFDESRVRLYDKDLNSAFVNIPYLNTGLASEHREVIEEERNIRCINSNDVIREFTSGRLSEAAMEKFFNWCEDAVRNGDFRPEEQANKAFIDCLRTQGQLYCEECGAIELKRIKQYTQLVHQKGLLPLDTIYIHQAQSYRTSLDLFGWTPLDPINWLKGVCRSDDITSEKPFDTRVLIALAGPNGIPATATETWKQAATHLESFECISTNHGLRKPSVSYLRLAGVVSDIPVANDRKLGDEVYERLGVRSRFSWDELLDQLEASTSYTNDRFLPYLADIVAKEGLTEQQIGDLRRRKVFDSDSEVHGKLAATALHQPGKLGDRLRELGLPMLGLEGVRATKDLLNKLGVRVYPPLQEVDKLLASSDKTKVTLGQQCLEENGVQYCEEAKKADFALIPTKGRTLARPNEVFSRPEWQELGFHIISSSLAEHAEVLGVQKNPPPDVLITRLENETENVEMTLWFKQLSQCVNAFTVEQLDKLKQVPFIPFAEPHLLAATRQRLADCFVMTSLPESKHHLRHVLPFVEFGNDGNLLAAKTAKTGSPKASDIAQAMVTCPRSFLELINVECYEEDLRDIAKEFDSFSEELRKKMRESSVLVGRRMQPDGPDEVELREACKIVTGGDKENLFDFRQSVFVAPVGLKALYEKLGSRPLDTCVSYCVHHTGTGPEIVPPLQLTPEDVLQCVNIFKKDDPEQDWQFDVAAGRLSVRACQALQLVKGLDRSLGVASENAQIPIPRREVAAGFTEDDSLTLWLAKESTRDIHTDIATALCRKLLKAHSGRDVLAMKLLLKDEDSREICGIPGSDDKKGMAMNTIDNAQNGTSQGKQHTRYKHSSEPLPLATSAKPTSVMSRIRLPWLSKRGKGCPVVLLKDDPIKSAKEAIDRTLRKTSPCDESNKSFRELQSEFKRKDLHCKQIPDTDLEVDERLKKLGIKFYWDKKSRHRNELEHVAEALAERVTHLASVFGVKDPASKFCIFWKDTDPNLMAFNRKGGYIYLNLAYYYHHHARPGHEVDEKRVVMEWYLIFAHEIAHNVSFHHDADHERAFAGLCVSRLDALRESFPHLGFRWA